MASGVISESRDNMHAMIDGTAITPLKGLGVKDEDARTFLATSGYGL